MVAAAMTAIAVVIVVIDGPGHHDGRVVVMIAVAVMAPAEERPMTLWSLSGHRCCVHTQKPKKSLQTRVRG